MITDLSSEQLPSQTCLASQVPGEQIGFYSIGGELVKEGEGGALFSDVKRIREVLEQVLGP